VRIGGFLFRLLFLARICDKGDGYRHEDVHQGKVDPAVMHDFGSAFVGQSFLILWYICLSCKDTLGASLGQNVVRTSADHFAELKKTNAESKIFMADARI